MYEFVVDKVEYVFNQDKMIIQKKDGGVDCSSIQTSDYLNRKRYFANVNFIMNNCCNMACDYCYANKGRYDVSGKVFDFETAKKVIDCMITVVEKNKGDSIHVTFFGGEPLLQFELIEKIVRYTNDCYSDIIRPRWDIVTNGTLITNKMVDFFVDNNFMVTISIDGSEETHNKRRHFLNGGDTYQIIIDNLSKFKSKDNLVARLTINEDNVDVLEAVRSIRKTGIKRIVIGIDNALSNPKRMLFEESLKKLFEQYCNDIKQKKYYIIDNIVRYFLKLALRKRTRYHCSSGLSYYSVSADEKVYLCHRFVGKEAGFVCDLSEGFLETIISASEENYDTFTSRERKPRMCAECQLLDICGGLCKYDAYEKTGEIFGFDIGACKTKKMYIDYTLKMVVSLSEGDRREFLKFYTAYMKKQKDSIYEE